MLNIEELEGEKPWRCAVCHRTLTPTWDNETEEELNIPSLAIDNDRYCDECYEQMSDDQVEDLLNGDITVSMRKINIQW